jgi:hypothetical protein
LDRALHKEDKGMARAEMIRKMMDKADELRKNYTYQGWEEIWEMCYEWNSTHSEEEEIFMAEHENEETGYVDGFYIEDDYWTFE